MMHTYIEDVMHVGGTFLIFNIAHRHNNVDCITQKQNHHECKIITQL